MNEEEKKDISDPRINYRADWAEKHGKRNEAANEKSNQAQGKKVERVRDAESGKVKSFEKLIDEGKEREGKTFADRVGKKEPIHSKKGMSEPHLKSTTALTDPETAKQNLKDASKAKNFGKETPPSRGGFRGGSSGRGGGFPMMREPDEILKEKNDAVNPEDILSKKGKSNSILLAMNQEKEPTIVNRNEKAPQQMFKEKTKDQHKVAQEKLEQKQKLQAKSFKPTQGTDVFDRLPKKTGDKDFKPKSATDIFDKKESLQKNVVKSEMPTPTPNKTAKPPKPSGGGQIKR